MKSDGVHFGFDEHILSEYLNEDQSRRNDTTSKRWYLFIYILQQKGWWIGSTNKFIGGRGHNICALYIYTCILF